MATQVNRAAIRSAVNTLFTGDPATLADLAAVHADLGWFANKPILHPEHPVVVEAAKAQPESRGEGLGFILCPSKATVSSSIYDKTVPMFADFQNLIGMFL